MRRKKKRMSTLKRGLLCSWCVFMLVLTFFVINWAMKLTKEDLPKDRDSIDVVTEVKPESVTPPVDSETKHNTPTATPELEPPQVRFEAEYAHLGEMTESFAYTEGVAYGMRFPLYEEDGAGMAVEQFAQGLLAETVTEMRDEGGSERKLLIDYEDGETAGLLSVLFHIEKEIDGRKKTESRMWLYNKKNGETADAETLFADLAYFYLAEQVKETKQSEKETSDAGEAEVTEGTEGMPEGTREAFAEYVLTADGAKFYYEQNGQNHAIVIPYIELHTYMAITVNGTVVAEKIRELDPDKPMIALTFDDGPHYQQTPRLLEILEKNNARATFFVLGDRVLWGASNEKALQMVYDSGNEVASHTYAHKRLKNLSVDEIKEEITKTRDAIFSVIGEYPTLVRPPYGGYNDDVKNYSYAPLITWNLDSKDWDFRNTEQVVEHVLAEARDGDIVLMHDIHWFTVDAAEILIPELTNRGYQIVTVQELFYYKGVELENGRVYHSSYN